MDELQYLLESSENGISFTIVYESSILKNNSEQLLKIGDNVKYLWPENKKTQQKYSGKILEISVSENYLLHQMDVYKEEYQKKIKEKRARKTRTTNVVRKGLPQIKRQLDEKILIEMDDQISLKKYKHNDLSMGKSKSKQISVSTGNFSNDIDLDNPRPSTSKNINQFGTSTNWIFDEIKNIRSYADACTASIVSLQDNFDFMNKRLEYLQNITSQLNEKQNSCNKELPCSLKLTGSFCKSNAINDESNQYYNNNKSVLETAHKSNTMKNSTSRRSYILSPIDDEFFEKQKENKITVKLQDENNDIKSRTPSPLLCVSPLQSDSPNLSRHSQRKLSIYISSDDDEDVEAIQNPEAISITKTEKDLNCREVNTNSQEDKENKEMNENSHHNSSIWTLKYLHADKENNVIELVHGSNIFVNAYALKNTITNSGRQTTLARALLDCVFTEEALLKCSIRGKKAHGKGSTADVRPGLHGGGVDAILTYSRRYAEKHKWEIKDRTTVIASLRQKSIELKDKKIMNAKN